MQEARQPLDLVRLEQPQVDDGEGPDDGRDQQQHQVAVGDAGHHQHDQQTDAHDDAAAQVGLLDTRRMGTAASAKTLNRSRPLETFGSSGAEGGHGHDENENGERRRLDLDGSHLDPPGGTEGVDPIGANMASRANTMPT